MIPVLKKIIKRYIPQNTFLQRIYLGFYYLGIWGMNYGISANPSESGEKNALRIIKRKIGSRNLTLFDVGANSGEYSLILNESFADSQIFAIEPIPDMHQLILDKTKNLSNIRTYQMAFGEAIGELPIFLNHQETKLASLVTYRGNFSNQTSVIVPINTVDNFCATHNINHIDLLKIDVEGYELNVLQGAHQMIQDGKINCIQFEFGGTMIDSKTYFRDIYQLLHKEYNIYRILKSGMYPINKYYAHLEIFHYSNFLAFKK